MENGKLTTTDIDLLFDGLDALETKAVSDHLMKSMFTAVLTEKGEKRDAIKQKDLEEFETIKQQNKYLGQRIILLKAKLIGMRETL